MRATASRELLIHTESAVVKVGLPSSPLLVNLTRDVLEGVSMGGRTRNLLAANKDGDGAYYFTPVRSIAACLQRLKQHSPAIAHASEIINTAAGGFWRPQWLIARNAEKAI